MTGQFTEVDPVRCRHYAKFMADLSVEQANAIFWLLFVSVLFLLYLSSRQHHKSMILNDLESGNNDPPDVIAQRKAEVRQLRRHYLGIVAICLMAGCVCVALEVFAAFNIEYCDGEDLMMLYWGFWSVLQVGSIIAIFGVMLQFWIVLGEVGMPSWGVAMGTPVLVVAALVYFWDHNIRILWHKKVKGSEWTESDRVMSRLKTRTNSISRATTVVDDPESSHATTRKNSRVSFASRPPSVTRCHTAPTFLAPFEPR